MRILHAPDYREGINYQEFLGDALKTHGVEVDYLSDYRRVLPLSRGVTPLRHDALHLHWPEKYFAKKDDLWDGFRLRRYPFDLARTRSHLPIFLTAHNLFPHNRGHEPRVQANMKATAKAASATFVHSADAKDQLIQTFGVPTDRVHIIPYGDHAVSLGAPISRSQARRHLDLPPSERICLMFGTISPYKGYEEIITFWQAKAPEARLIVAGPILDAPYANKLRQLSADCDAVTLRISDKWLNDEDLRDWLSAVDCTIFNYRTIFTSGAAGLARSFGVPLLIPKRLASADLQEPHSHVIRFESPETDLEEKLTQALSVKPDYDAARPWREATSWERVASITKEVYEKAL